MAQLDINKFIINIHDMAEEIESQGMSVRLSELIRYGLLKQNLKICGTIIKNVIEPKFMVGDTIRNKTTKETTTICGIIDNNQYALEYGYLIFDSQDDWELVEEQH